MDKPMFLSVKYSISAGVKPNRKLRPVLSGTDIWLHLGNNASVSENPGMNNAAVTATAVAITVTASMSI